MNWSLPNFTLKILFFHSCRWLLTRTLYIYQPHKWQEMAFCCKTSWQIPSMFGQIPSMFKQIPFISFKLGGWVRQRCRVSYVTAASSWYWPTVGQGLLSLQQVRRNVFYFFCLFTFIHFPFPLSSYLSLLSLFSLSRRRHKMTHKGWRVKLQLNHQLNLSDCFHQNYSINPKYLNI